MQTLRTFNCAVLFIFGSGPIKGFATTLLIGIVTSLFTSILLQESLSIKNIAKS
jgi:SecD/SecF fusion protein